MRTNRLALVFSAIAFMAIAASAFAAPAPPVRPVTIPTPIAAKAPLRPVATLMPTLAPNNAGKGPYVGAVAKGTVVPLSRLPRLPIKTKFNTYTPLMVKGRLRPMSANGAYYAINSTACNGGTGGDYGYFQVPCSLNWTAEAMPTDSLEDYTINYNEEDESTASAVATNGPYTGPTGSTNTLSMNNAGTYLIATYDITKSEWVTVSYFTAGAAYAIKVYSDPFHTSEQYQFDASSSTYAYIYLQNVSQSDQYVVAVNQAGVNPNCVFMAPAPLPSPYSYPSNQLCNYTSSPGVAAPGGSVSFTWQLSASYPAGTYAVEVYDLTLGQRLGVVQVALTSSSGIVLSTVPYTGADANPSPSPVTGATPGTILAWDGGGVPGPADQSVSGITASVTGAQNGSYLWTLVDPNGQVAASKSATISTNSGNTFFQFDTLTGGAYSNLLPPGRYPQKSFTLQLYNTGTKTVTASQAFSIVGYSTQTQFDTGGTLGNALQVTAAACCASPTQSILRFTNTSNEIFQNAGDNINEIEFTTGEDYKVTSGNGLGVYIGTASGSVCTTTCTTTTSDEAGNSWSETITCTSTYTTTGECTVLLTPVSASTFLSPTGSDTYVDTTNLYFYEDTGANCGNTCQGLTSEFPQHGQTWSCSRSIVLTSCASASLAWSPVYFNSAASVSGQASMQFIGSTNFGNPNTENTPFSTTAQVIGTPPFTGNHWYWNYGYQEDYNMDSPWQASMGGSGGSSNMDELLFNVENNSTSATGWSIYDVAIEFPPIIHNQGLFEWFTNQLTAIGCPSGLPEDTECFNLANSVARGRWGQFDFLMTPPVQSLAPVDLVVFGCFGTNGNNCQEWIQLPAVTPTRLTPDQHTTTDQLAMGFMSLNSGDMTSYFSPSTFGVGSTTTLGFTFTNTSTAVDANPDSVDALVLVAPNATDTLATTGMTFSNANWSYLNGSANPYTGQGNGQFYFGLCATQHSNSTGGTYAGPDQANGATTLYSQNSGLTSGYGNSPGTGTCTAAQESAGSLKPGQSVTVSGMSFSGLNTAGTQTWQMFAHGANGGGWSGPINLTLTLSTESSSIWFNQVNGTNVAANSLPTIGSSPNTYQYAIKNTSKTMSIGTIAIRLPGTDINGQNATDSSGTQWTINNIDTAGTITLSSPPTQADGTGTCVVSTASSGVTGTFNATTAGVDGQIYISGCTKFKPGDTIYVNFTATNPSSQSDSYIFSAKTDSTNVSGTTWLGSDEVNEQFSLGLDIVVDPSNDPTTGDSTPVVICQNTCAFSGNTIDFGNIPDSTTYTFQDVVRTSVIYTGATSAGKNMTLSVAASANPARSCATPPCNPLDELLTQTDSAHSTGTSPYSTYITYGATSYTVIPVSPSTLTTATIQEQQNPEPYDIINSYEVNMGTTDSTNARIVTLTYTLIAN